jgi:hypothetical protein
MADFRPLAIPRIWLRAQQRAARRTHLCALLILPALCHHVASWIRLCEAPRSATVPTIRSAVVSRHLAGLGAKVTAIIGDVPLGEALRLGCPGRAGRCKDGARGEAKGERNPHAERYWEPGGLAAVRPGHSTGRKDGGESRSTVRCVDGATKDQLGVTERSLARSRDGGSLRAPDGGPIHSIQAIPYDRRSCPVPLIVQFGTNDCLLPSRSCTPSARHHSRPDHPQSRYRFPGFRHCQTSEGPPSKCPAPGPEFHLIPLEITRISKREGVCVCR